MIKRFKIGLLLMLTMVLVLVTALPALATTSAFTISSVFPEAVLSTLGAVLVLILVDTVLGILVSIKKGKFAFRKLSQFLATNVLSYVGGLLILALGASISSQLAAIFYAAAAATSVKFLADIKDKVKEVFGSVVESK